MLKKFIDWLCNLFVYCTSETVEEPQIKDTVAGWTTKVIKLGYLMSLLMMSSCTTTYYVRTGNDLQKFYDPEVTESYINTMQSKHGVQYIKVTYPERHVEYYIDQSN